VSATGLQLGSDGISQAKMAQWGSGDISQAIVVQWGSGGYKEAAVAAVRAVVATVTHVVAAFM
jgi:hypothetical protein